MEELDANSDLESLHHIDYDILLDHVVQDDPELLYLDTYLREILGE